MACLFWLLTSSAGESYCWCCVEGLVFDCARLRVCFGCCFEGGEKGTGLFPAHHVCVYTTPLKCLAVLIALIGDYVPLRSFYE